MKLTYLGTAAAEGFPAVFCRCKFCREARSLGGKNVRTRSQALIDDTLLIDLPADTYAHFLANGIEGDKIENLLITHSHGDHFYPNELAMRHGAYAHDMRAKTLGIYCGEGVYSRLALSLAPNLSLEKILPFDTVQIGDYKVTAFPARHAPGDGALFYSIEGDRHLLYAHDTGYFYEEVFEFMERKALRFDTVSLDCTNVDIPVSDEGHHMGIDNLERLVERLSDIGAIDDNTVIVINHFSHNANPLQTVLEERVADKGWLVSYDGMTIDV